MLKIIRRRMFPAKNVLSEDCSGEEFSRKQKKLGEECSQRRIILSEELSLAKNVTNEECSGELSTQAKRNPRRRIFDEKCSDEEFSSEEFSGNLYFCNIEW
jgi:hypothetical protein